jgi:Domain of unknown function (DUF4055)
MASDITYNRISEEALERWRITTAVVSGDQALKALKVLPYLNSADMTEENKARNASYVDRAVFYNATGRTLDGLLGVAFKKDPTTILPEYLSYLLTDCDGMRNSLYQKAQATVSNLLKTGRDGLMVDFNNRLQKPVISAYAAESIINWKYDDTGGLVLVVLEESIEVRDGYEVKNIMQWRELMLVNGVCVVKLWQLDKDKKPQIVQIKDADGNMVDELIMRSKSKPLDFIPFRFVGSRNNDATIDDVPLYALAKLNVAHYRNSADYEDSVFYVGQAQPWISGLTEEWRDDLVKSKQYIGSRSPFLLPEGGAFGFAQPSPNTLVYEAMEQKEKQMVALGARVLDQNAIQVTATQSDNDKEASTSVLSICCANASEAFQTAINWCARLLDKELTKEQEQETFKINQDYSTMVVDSQAVTSLVGVWQSKGIALSDLRAYLRKQGIIATERTDQEIDDDLDAEPPMLGVNDGNSQQ